MKRYYRNTNTISGRLSDELVMMDIEKGNYYALNPVATRIWDLLETPMGTEELCITLMEEYEVDRERCTSELTELLSEMVKLQLVIEETGRTKDIDEEMNGRDL